MHTASSQEAAWMSVHGASLDSQDWTDAQGMQRSFLGATNAAQLQMSMQPLSSDADPGYVVAAPSDFSPVQQLHLELVQQHMPWPRATVQGSIAERSQFCALLESKPGRVVLRHTQANTGVALGHATARWPVALARMAQADTLLPLLVTGQFQCWWRDVMDGMSTPEHAPPQ